jgi:hypothetical protein
MTCGDGKYPGGKTRVAVPFPWYVLGMQLAAALTEMDDLPTFALVLMPISRPLLKRITVIEMEAIEAEHFTVPTTLTFVGRWVDLWGSLIWTVQLMTAAAAAEPGGAELVAVTSIVSGAFTGAEGEALAISGVRGRAVLATAKTTRNREIPEDRAAMMLTPLMCPPLFGGRRRQPPLT